MDQLKKLAWRLMPNRTPQLRRATRLGTETSVDSPFGPANLRSEWRGHPPAACRLTSLYQAYDQARCWGLPTHNSSLKKLFYSDYIQQSQAQVHRRDAVLLGLGAHPALAIH